MNVKDRIIMMVLCSVLSMAAHAQDSHWQYDANAFRYDMTVYYSLEYKSENVADLTTFEVAAFCGNECRGIGKGRKVTLKNGNTVSYGYMRVRSDLSSGEEISFKVYHKTLGVESPVAETLTFQNEARVGMPSTPMKLTVVGPGLDIGDANSDGRVDIADVTAIINKINGVPSTSFNPTVADVNNDGKIDISDVTGIINIINSVNTDSTGD